MPDRITLRQFQALPLTAKITMSKNRIYAWYEHFDGKVCVSFSGGKDSTVLAHLVHSIFPEVPLVFANTGLEYPEIQAFAKKMGAEFVRPKMSFSEVISTYGYPIISKENAEAIYYARRIKNGGGYSIPRSRQKAARTGWKTIRQKRAELCGTRQIGGGATESDKCSQESADWRERKSGTSWKKWRRRTIAGVDEFGKKSIFNKEKWLPLCRDTMFKISHKCCSVMKKSPLDTYARQHKVVPYLGTLAEESKLREQRWMEHGCNAFDAKHKTSQPLSFWTEQDILWYIEEEGLEIASVYGEIVSVDGSGFCYAPIPGLCTKLKCSGCQRTGCIFCGFGVHLEKGETRFQRLARTHPKQYEYCMGGGQWVDNPEYDPTAPKMDGDWQNWNPKKIWVPSKQGLGMRHVFDECNALYGKDFIRYE